MKSKTVLTVLGMVLGSFLCLPLSTASAQPGWAPRWTFFDPATNGWPFPNDRFKVCAAPTCIPENTVGSFGHQFLEARWALCGGMSLSALRRFKEGTNIEPYSSSLKDHELIPAQLKVVAEYGDTFVEWNARPDVGHPTDIHSMRISTKKEWWTVRAAIDKGAPIMLGLILVKQTYDPAKIFDNHVVLAVGYSYNDSTQDAKLYVYDSRDPENVDTIGLHVGDGALGLTDTLKDPVFRGFFAMSLESGPPKAPPAAYFVPVQTALQ